MQQQFFTVPDCSPQPTGDREVLIACGSHGNVVLINRDVSKKAELKSMMAQVNEWSNTFRSSPSCVHTSITCYNFIR